MGMNWRKFLGLKIPPVSVAGELANEFDDCAGHRLGVGDGRPALAGSAGSSASRKLEEMVAAAVPASIREPAVASGPTEVACGTDTARAALMAQAEKVRPGMTPAEIAELAHPEIRAEALWGCDLIAHRDNPQLKALVEGVAVPEARAYGAQVQILYAKALKARSDKNNEVFERERQKRARRMSTSLTAQLMVGSILANQDQGR